MRIHARCSTSAARARRTGFSTWRTRRSIGIPQDSLTPTDRVSPPSIGSPPAVTVVEISDSAIAGQGIEMIDLDAVQLTSTPFRARRVVVRLEGGALPFDQPPNSAHKDCFGERTADTLRRRPSAAER
jgi:hypothetical protein